MSVGFYRCIKNREMSRFSKFSKRIIEKHKDTDVIYNPNRGRCITKINLYDTLVIIAHGGSDVIYHKYDHKNYSHQPLINKDSIQLLRGKKVIALSCLTARELGPYACETGGCKVYLGFYNKIHFDKKDRSATIEYRKFIKECYKEAFKNVIDRAIENNWDFSKISVVLEIELKKTVMKRVENIRQYRMKFYEKHDLDKAIFAVTNVASNIRIFGDSKEKIS
ncbi:MAG: hypothetical protein K0S34_424 [Bacillales bacterium]|jgi:hypothetical protein|nr:hypothetical protein [Bacillales bacterium]